MYWYIYIYMIYIYIYIYMYIHIHTYIYNINWPRFWWGNPWFPCEHCLQILSFPVCRRVNVLGGLNCVGEHLGTTIFISNPIPISPSWCCFVSRYKGSWKFMITFPLTFLIFNWHSHLVGMSIVPLTIWYTPLIIFSPIDIPIWWEYHIFRHTQMTEHDPSIKEPSPS